MLQVSTASCKNYAKKILGIKNVIFWLPIFFKPWMDQPLKIHYIKVWMTQLYVLYISNATFSIPSYTSSKRRNTDEFIPSFKKATNNRLYQQEPPFPHPSHRSCKCYLAFEYALLLSYAMYKPLSDWLFFSTAFCLLPHNIHIAPSYIMYTGNQHGHFFLSKHP